MANRLEAGRQHLLEKPPNGEGTGDPNHPLAPLMVGAHAQPHRAVPDRYDALVGKGGAMGIGHDLEGYWEKWANGGPRHEVAMMIV
jgi:hypothetical protein